MFEHLSELTKATVRQKIALNTMMTLGGIDWVDYGKNGTLIVKWYDEDSGCGNTFVIDKKGNVKECIIYKDGTVRECI